MGLSKTNEVGSEKAEAVGKPKGDDEQHAVDDLEKLEVEFLFSTEHSGWRGGPRAA